MNELIKVDFSGERPAVSARELHEFLGVETRFNDWFSRMCEYGFLEGEDFYSFLSKTPTGGRPAQDAALSIDMAKEICMLQRNEKGKLARQYFLALERDWNSPERVMARALEIAHEKTAVSGGTAGAGPAQGPVRECGGCGQDLHPCGRAGQGAEAERGGHGPEPSVHLAERERLSDPAERERL